ncbi:class I SAM-dependent DNA methyltransferase [Salibacterium aidingense]|uniref:class I SAM-dependent DNA methyltransferase n=1 Tax=Salibacterium aidingense TaxID=384933 RepID=UPI00040E4730|nr:class I SAM-dependent methyltransferase [Salibacterium aidingense]
MHTYSGFAQVYDRLMEEAPYQEWLQWVMHLFKREENQPAVLLDAGCGTGTLLELLLMEGYDAHGLDISEDMLAVAQQKVNEKGFYPNFYLQDMTNLQHTGQYDAILAFCDSLNYITTEDDIRAAFRSFYEHLYEGGLLVFDVHSIYYVEHILHDFSFADAADDVSYIWNTFPVRNKGEVEHELSFFIKEKEETYRRHDEIHRQRTLPVSHYTSFLKKAGFEVCGIFADFTFERPQHNSERLFFYAKKPVQRKEKEINW